MTRGKRDVLFYGIAGAATLLIVATINIVFLKAPVEKTMGIVQKIFYFHVPSAYAMYIGAAACCVGSIAYLLKPTDARDALARAGAEVAVVFGVIVLTTGPLWAAKAWGYYWTWDPRLTTALLQVLIYVAYLVLRGFTGDGPGERKFAAALGVLGAANLPIIHYSVQKWSGQHPAVITGNGGGLQSPDMKLALTLSFVAFTLFAVALLWARVRVELAKSRLARAEEDAIDLGLDERTEAIIFQQPAPSASTPDSRATTFQPVESGGEQRSGETLLVEAYVVLWVILMGWLFFLWRKQNGLHARLDDLERVIDKAADAKESKPKAG